MQYPVRPQPPPNDDRSVGRAGGNGCSGLRTRVPAPFPAGRIALAPPCGSPPPVRRTGRAAPGAPTRVVHTPAEPAAPVPRLPGCQGACGALAAPVNGGGPLGPRPATRHAACRTRRPGRPRGMPHRPARGRTGPVPSDRWSVPPDCPSTALLPPLETAGAALGLPRAGSRRGGCGARRGPRERAARVGRGPQSGCRSPRCTGDRRRECGGLRCKGPPEGVREPEMQEAAGGDAGARDARGRRRGAALGAQWVLRGERAARGRGGAVRRSLSHPFGRGRPATSALGPAGAAGSASGPIPGGGRRP